MNPVQALIVVDMQRGVLADLPDASSLTARIESAVSRASAAGALVVQLQNDGAPGSVDEPGTPGWALVLAGGEVVRKTTDDGFAGTRLDSLLSGVGRVALCGVLSEMCVSATARSALARGYEVVLPHDGHGTYDLDDIPAAVVARVAEHALGDQPELVPATTNLTFTAANPARPPTA
ncbi:MAG TPA: isochorismatase family protein [Mycobacteriales bacterium]